MSRSRRKHPICGITASGCKYGEHEDKKRASRRLRHKTRQMIRSCNVESDPILPELRELSDIWWFRKDGKLRFNPDRSSECMRK